MTEYVASVPRVDLLPLPGYVLLAALVGMALCIAGFALRGRLQKLAFRGASSALVAGGVLAVAPVRSLQAPDRILIDAILPSLRIGSLDAALVFELDQVSTAVLAAILFVLAYVASRLTYGGKVPDRARLLAIHALGLGAALTLLSDNFVYALIGLAVLELGRSAGRESHRLPFRVSDASLVVGFGLLFWGLGGSWSGSDGFVPELRPRLGVIERPGANADAPPALSLTSLPGAKVRLGGKLFETAPFVNVPVRAGVHTVTVSAGPGTDELLIENLRIEGPREIIVTGPSLVFRELRNGFELKDGTGSYPIAATFARAELFGIPVAMWVAVLIAFGLGARIGDSFALGLRSGVRPIELVGSCCWLSLLWRTPFLLDFAPYAFAVAAAGGGLAAAVLPKFSGRLAEILGSAARRIRGFDARIAGWLVAVSMVLVSGTAAAQDAITIRPLSGAAPLELARKGGAYEAGFVVENRGTERVRGVRLSVPQGSELIPSSPAGLSARFGDGAETITLGPGEARPGIVRFSPSGRPALRDLYAHVFVVQEDQTRAALGVHVEADDDLIGKHGLSLVLLCPVIGLLGIGASALARYRRLRALRAGFVAIACAKLGILLALWPRFDTLASRLDGNGGYQFIERFLISRSFGVEYFVGVDGFGLAALLALAVIFVQSSLFSLAVARDVPKFLAGALLLDLSLSLVVMAVDSALLVAALLLVVLARLLLVPASRLFRLVAGAGVIAFAFGLALSLDAVPQGYLVDGTPNPGAPSLLELAQASARWVGHADQPLLGVALIVVGLLALSGAPPFQVINLAFARKLHPAMRALAIASVSCMTFHLLLRVGLGALPSAFAELAPYLAWLGVVAVGHAALASFGASDPVEVAIYGAGAHTGIVFVGLAAGTAIGIQGAELVALGGSLGMAGAFGVAMAISSRMPSAGFGDVRGVGRELVDLSLLAATLIGALSLAPLSAAFVGLLLVIVGALPFDPALACAAALAAASITVGICGVWVRLFLGPFADAHRKLPELEPHAGRLPALAPRERFGFVLVSLLSSLLGLWPRPLLSVTDGAAVDYAEPINPPGPLQVSQTAHCKGRS